MRNLIKKIFDVVLGVYFKELYCKNGWEISFYYNLNLLICVSWSSFKLDKELHRYHFQIGALGCFLRITKFKKI